MTVQQDIDDWNEIKSSRGLFENSWQELAELMLPNSAEFTSRIVKGEPLVDHIFDSTPEQSRRDLASSMGSLLMSKSRKWFIGSTGDDDLDNDDEVKIWLEETSEKLFNAIYNPKARFVQRTKEVNDELVTFGTAVLFIGKSRNGQNLMFRSVPLSRAFIRENSDGVVDTIFVRDSLTARQAADRYGKDKIGRMTREHLNDKDAKKDKKFDFIQIVKPRKVRDTGKIDNLNMPWSDTIIDLESKHQVRKSGFEEFPFAVPRWDTSSSELYGRSPAMIALPDSLTLQAMGETLLTAGQKAVDPPLLVVDDSVFGSIRSFPGGLTTIDADAARDSAFSPVTPLFTGANIPLGREMQQDARELVQQAFFRDVLRLPAGGPQMTAFEIAQRREEFVRSVGPVFGQLEEDYPSKLVDITFSIMLRQDGFKRPPDVLIGRDIKWVTRSPVERARRQIEAVAMTQAMELLIPFQQSNPDLMDHFDVDQIVRDTDDIFGFPSSWLKPQDQVDGIRQARAEQAEAERTKQDIALAAQTAKTGAESESIEGQLQVAG